MIREVIIDNQQIDVTDDDVAGYIFTSPIFRDISKILSNRTTTYKIPKTQNNLRVFELSDNPDVLASFPYREHTFEEIRDGLTFIKGICALLKVADEYIELSVIWGNTINILKLKDLKLRDFISKDYIEWSNQTGFIKVNSDDTKGFLAVDFGRGINLEYTHPSVSMQYILDLIYQETNVLFTYPKEFNDSIKKTWIPLIDKQANAITWEDQRYYLDCAFTQINKISNEMSFFKFVEQSYNSDLIGQDTLVDSTYIKAKEGTNVVLNGFLNIQAPSLINGEYPLGYKFRIYLCDKFGAPLQEQIADIIANDSGEFTISMQLNLSYGSNSKQDIYVGGCFIKENKRYSLEGSVLNLSLFKVYVRYEEIRFGDKYPIVENLPDISAIDFIKTIMNMFGLFTYYDFKDSSTIDFVSMDNVYGYKPEAIDCTNKLVKVSDTRMQLTFTYGEYAQRNNFYYKKDDTVSTSANGFITVDNQTLKDKTDLVTLLFAPSDNVTDDNANTYAKIKLYNDDGGTNNVEYRILKQGKYNTGNSGNPQYISAYFPEEYSFAGNNGLLKKYYSAYQYILRQPVVAECYIYFQDYELHQFKEVYPIYIDGVYYMPIEVTVMSTGYARASLIKMPSGWVSPR